MNPVYQTYNTVTDFSAAQGWVNLDFYKAPFTVSVAVWLNGPAQYWVEYTFDDITTINANPTPRVFTDPTLGPTQTSSGVTSYTFPITGVRINIQSTSGTVEFKVIQGTAINAI
jgi:hypothetical protein